MGAYFTCPVAAGFPILPTPAGLHDPSATQSSTICQSLIGRPIAYMLTTEIRDGFVMVARYLVS